MVNVEMNKELDNYLSTKRRKSSQWTDDMKHSMSKQYGKLVEKFSKEKEPDPSEIQKAIEHEQMKEEHMENPEPEYGEHDEYEQMEEELEERPTIMERFNTWLKGSQELEEEHEEPTKDEEFEDELNELEKEEEALERQEAEIRKSEGRIWTRMAAIFQNKIPEETIKLDREVADLKNDLRTVALISTDIMQRMPTQVFKEFKTSHKYEEFVQILEKHELVKRTKAPEVEEKGDSIPGEA